MDEKETGRIEAFSDGVFAVAITLLVLDIHAPARDALPRDTKLIDYLLNQWSTYLAFVTSFANIGIMWVNHHRLYIHIKRSDNTLLLLNLLLLMIIVLIPFPTALMADYITKLGPDQLTAALVYNGTFLLMAICFNLLWRYASYKNRLLNPNANMREVQAITGQYNLGPLFYIITFIIAFVSPLVSVTLELLLAIFFAVPGRKISE